MFRQNDGIGQLADQKYRNSWVRCRSRGKQRLFITTSSFTREAIEYAKKQLQVKLILVDGSMLTKLMIEYNLGVSVENTYEIKRIDMDYFDDEI